jgi:predicted type IV restriction endonuclease
MAAKPAIESVLREVSARIERFRNGRPLNEQNTKSSLIEPVLRALGWDLEDPDEVHHEYKNRPKDRPVDYALLVSRTVRLLLEAKGMSQDLNDRKFASQIVSYAAVAGAEWVVLTDGDEWRIYNATAPVDVEEKLLRSVTISSDPSGAARTLALLGKKRMLENPLHALWRIHHIDRQVGSVLRRFLRPDHSSEIAKQLAKSLPKLSEAEIRASYARFDVNVHYREPIDATDAIRTVSGTAARVPKVRSVKGTPSRERAATSASLADLIATGVLKPPFDLTAEYRGQRVAARIESDARVTFEGNSYDSLSSAATAAQKHVLGSRAKGMELAVNGWSFWKVPSTTGAPVEVGTLRNPGQVRRPGSVGARKARSS